MIVLGIETSCDETAVAVVNSDKKICFHQIYSQIPLHQQCGGVVPELAARKHCEILPKLVYQALTSSDISTQQLSGIAVTTGPGLHSSLLVGLSFAKALAYQLNLPLIPVNHLEAHLLTPRLTDKINFPFLAVLLSGGNTQFVIVYGVGKYEIIGETIDDAIGEAYDKTARLLGFPYPGGKNIEKLASTVKYSPFNFPAPLYNSNDCLVSFSGLKTAVNQTITRLISNGELTELTKAQIAKAFQDTVIKLLTKKTISAIKIFKEKTSANILNATNNATSPAVVVSGGVAANQAIITALKEISKSSGIKLYAPPVNLCGDNGAMVAWAGIEKYNLTLNCYLPSDKLFKTIKSNPCLSLNNSF